MKQKMKITIMTADKVFLNGIIHTENDAKDCVEALAVAGSKILFAGSRAEAEALIGPDTEIIDLNGRVLLPAFIDGHTHPATVAKSRWRIRLPEFETKEELLQYVKDYCEEHPVSEVPYFFGEFYSSTMFGEDGPRKEWIDAYVSDRPVRLQEFTDHACWYNSRALKLMGIDASVEEDGVWPLYVRDPDNEPTGLVMEPVPSDDGEERMYEQIGWHPPTEVTEETILPFLDFLKDNGVIGLLDGITEGEESMKFFHDLDAAGKLNMYYKGTCLLEEFSELDTCIATLRDWQAKYTTEHVYIDTVKLFADGTNELGDSASLEPYYNDPAETNYGVLNYDEDELAQIMTRLNDEKLDLHIHVVGDRGFRTCCNAYERAKDAAEAAGKSWEMYLELAHCELVHPDDMIRPAELGIFINWTPHWAGGYFGDAAIDYLGRERWEKMYDFTTMLEAGAVVTCSSDVTGVSEEKRANPYFGMQVCATRIDPEDPVDKEKYPQGVRPPAHAKLPVETLIDGYTRQGARALRLEEKTGVLAPGRMANLMVLNRDIYQTPPEELGTISPELVMFEGAFIKGFV